MVERLVDVDGGLQIGLCNVLGLIVVRDVRQDEAERSQPTAAAAVRQYHFQGKALLQIVPTLSWKPCEIPSSDYVLPPRFSAVR